MAGDIYVARESASLYRADGPPLQVVRDKTTVREGHPLLAQYPALFRKLSITFDLPDPVPAPAGSQDLGTQGRKRSPVDTPAASAQEARSR